MSLPMPNSFKRDFPAADDASAYTMHTVIDDTSRSPLLSSSNPAQQYGSIPPVSDSRSWRSIRWTRHKPLLAAAIKCCAIFILSCVILGTTLWLALPTLDDEDKLYVRIPKSFEQLKQLNSLLKKYRDIYPVRVVVCYVVVYLFLQAFSLPGSMYLSILGGAVWGMPRAILLACTCVATGATLCYLLSAAFGPALLTLPKWRLKLDKWSEKVEAQRSNIYSFMIIIRIAPFPPHWVVNVLCPHLRIGIVPFWISTWLGILGVTIIHTAIGGGLDEMTSPEEFNLLSLKNFLLLASIAFAVLIPVGLRHVLSRRTGALALPESPNLAARNMDTDDMDGLSIASDEFVVGKPVPVYSDGDHSTISKTIVAVDMDSDSGSLRSEVEDDHFLSSGGPLIDKGKGVDREES